MIFRAACSADGSQRRAAPDCSTPLVPVEPCAQGGKASICRAEHADPWIGVEKFAARPLVPFVHPDHREWTIRAGCRLDDSRRAGAARRSVRKDHRQHQRTEAGIVEKCIEAESECLRRFQHFGGQVRRIADRAEIRDNLAQGAVRFRLQCGQLDAMGFRLVGTDHGGPAGCRENADAYSLPTEVSIFAMKAAVSSTASRLSTAIAPASSIAVR